MGITIIVTESPLQLLAGIPSNVIIETNVPSTIFYTLDGTEPTVLSNVVVGPVVMPTDSADVILMVFATDGVNTSPIITQEYKTDSKDLRRPYDTVCIEDYNCHQSTYPFGPPVAGMNIPYEYGNTGGVIVDNQEKPRVPDGYDGFGNPAGYVNSPECQYDFLFSDTNAIGEMGRGIGTLPGHVLWVKPRNNNKQKEHTNAAGPLFDPRALVIFQDSRETPYDPDVPKINRPYFDLEDYTRARDGGMLTTTDPITPMGSFLKAHYNPTDNCLIYYYYDNRAGRWIISKEPYSPSENPTANLSSIMTRGRGNNVGLVFKWIPFQYRVLV